MQNKGMDAWQKAGHDSDMFTLAHLSDPHLAPLPDARLSQLLNKRATGLYNWRKKRRFIHDPAVLSRIVADMKALRPDHIAATGDLTNIGLPAEFDRARDWLGGLGAPDDVSAVPGNHDAYVARSLAEMQRACGAFMTGDDGRTGFPFVRRRGPVALIGLSSGVPTAPFIASGRLGEAQLARFATLLQSLERDGAFRAVLIHHPPVSKRARHRGLRDAPDFLRTIARHGAELVMHGHDHVHELIWLDGPQGRVPSVGVPSASAVPGGQHDGAAYNLYRIDGKRGAWLCEMETRGLDATGDIGTLMRAPLLP
jgi:3',5'-cyclic AMP phosphodiesterase CpdA